MQFSVGTRHYNLPNMDLQALYGPERTAVRNPDHPADHTPPDQSTWADELSIEYLSRAEVEERVRDRSQRARQLDKYVHHEFILDMSAFARGTAEQQWKDKQTEEGASVLPVVSEADVDNTATRYKAFEQ